MRVEGGVPRLYCIVFRWPDATDYGAAAVSSPQAHSRWRMGLDTHKYEYLPATRSGRRRMWVVLWHSQWIMVSGWKIRLQILLDVVLHSKLGTQVNHPQGVILPVDVLAVLTEVVGLANLEEVNEIMSSSDNLQTGFHRKRGLQAYPSKDALVMESLERRYAVSR
jgi:hypothetical protein